MNELRRVSQVRRAAAKRGKAPGVAACLAALLIATLGCDPASGPAGNAGGSGSGATSAVPRFITMGTAPSGGAFFDVGNAIASVINEHRGDAKWTVQPSATKGTQQNIRMLDKGEALLGMSNAAISYFAARGEGVWDRPYQVRAVMTLAPNVGLFIAKRESGIRTLADLKGKRVAVGPAGAGFETFLGPLLTAHGVTYTDQTQDFTPVAADYTTAVQLLGDGNIDAAFMGGAIPVAAITQATSTMDIVFLPFDEAARQKLIAEYPFFNDAVVPAKNAAGQPTYKGLEQDLPAINVGSMQLLTHANVDEDLIYTLTKIIWENREAITARHPAGRAINEANAARDVGTEFHPGAIKFYKEIGIWKSSDGAE